MSHYNMFLPSYSIGSDCYNEIAHVTRHFGNTAVVIGGKTAMSKAHDALVKAVEGTHVTITDFIWFGGDSTYENGHMLMENEAVKNADMIFAVGGGRACDTCKYVANELDKPLFCFPTVASNCASVTAICVIYNPDGSFREYYYPKLANHTFINSDIIADSPYQLLWAGIGDALSKECEAVFSSKDVELSHTPLMGVQLSHVCTKPLIDFGAKALEACRAKRTRPNTTTTLLLPTAFITEPPSPKTATSIFTVKSYLSAFCACLPLRKNIRSATPLWPSTQKWASRSASTIWE